MAVFERIDLALGQEVLEAPRAPARTTDRPSRESGGEARRIAGRSNLGKVHLMVRACHAAGEAFWAT